jgi:hypothetical protein
MGQSSRSREWKSLRYSKRQPLTKSKFFLKKPSPKQFSPGLELSFIERRVAQISSKENGWMRKVA